MENSVLKNGDVHHNRTCSSYSSSSQTQRDVLYRFFLFLSLFLALILLWFRARPSGCGTCGYELNLSSSNRNTSSIGSKYGKSIKRGIISFFNIDDSRFTQVDEIECAPHFSKHSWGLFRRKTKLLCRKCCNHIGNAYNGYTSSSFPLVSNEVEPSPGTETPTHTKYDIRIRALQPSSQEYEICVFA